MSEMNELIIGIGEGLGLHERKKQGLVQGVRRGGETVIVDHDTYKTWQIAKMAGYEEEQFPRILDVSQAVIATHLKKLDSLELVIRWSEDQIQKLFKTYSITPKGRILEKKDDEFVFEEIPKSPSHTFPLFPTTIWRMSNPYYSLEEIREQLTEITGFSKQETGSLMVEWIPLLIESGLLTIDKVRK